MTAGSSYCEVRIHQPISCLSIEFYKFIYNVRGSIFTAVHHQVVWGLGIGSAFTTGGVSHSPSVQRTSKRPTPVRRRFSITQAFLGRSFPVMLTSGSGIKRCKQDGDWLRYCIFHRSAALVVVCCNESNDCIKC